MTGAGGGLRVAFDPAHPASWLAYAPTCRLADRLSIEVDWLPFAARPFALPPERREHESRGERHVRQRAEYRLRELRHYAAARGLPLDALERAADPLPLRLCALWIRRHAGSRELRRFFDATLGAWWSGALAPPDASAWIRGDASPAVPSEGLDAWLAASGREALDALRAELAEQGVLEAPAYLVGDDCFVGREHLPLVERMLDRNREPLRSIQENP